MHCPRCGQQQVSTDTKFCSKCGFQLAIVSELLIHGGALPELAAIQKKRSFLNKKNGVTFGVIWFIFFTMFLTSVFAILNADRLAPLCAVIGVFGSLSILIASLVMLPSSRSTTRAQLPELPLPAPQAGLYGGASQSSLPPPQQEPAGIYSAPQGSWRAPDTGDLVDRGSVIENTTRLLNKDQE